VSPGGATVNKRRAYSAPPRLRLHQWALSGEWTVKTEAAVLNAAGGRIAIRCRFWCGGVRVNLRLTATSLAASDSWIAYRPANLD
jgi:hypothetical protein